MLDSNKKRYGVSFFGSFLFHSFSLSFSVPPPPPYPEARIPKRFIYACIYCGLA